MSKENPSLLFWMNMPSHHQSDFFKAIRETGSDIKVCYYGNIKAKRKELGWVEYHKLPEGEKFVEACVSSVDTCHDWKEHVHIIPGYGSIFLQKLVIRLCKEKCFWMHWSEPARSGFRWWISFPVKFWYARMVNRHALAALAIGEMARRDFLKWGIRKKIEILPYAIKGFTINGDADRIVSDFSMKHRPFYVYVGMLSYRKGTDLLLQALSIVAQKFPNVGLALVGCDSGDMNYRGLAGKLGIREKVLFRGTIKADKIGTAIRLGDILLLPSRFDGWGMSLNEGASLAKALVATDRCGSAYHLIKDGENGFVVPAGDVYAFADRMEKYAREPQLAEAHGRNSLKVFSGYTPEANVKRLSNILQKLGFSNPAELEHA